MSATSRKSSQGATSVRVAAQAARARVQLDKKLGHETPQRIKDLAAKGK